MNPDSAAIENAFHDFLAARGLSVNELTLGSAFKVMLEFQRDVKFDWVDPEYDTLLIGWDKLRDRDPITSEFLGIFKTVTPGELIGYQAMVSRTLDHLDVERTESVILSVIFKYAVTNSEIADFAADWEGGGIDQFDSESLEEFVMHALEIRLFKALALEKPRSVEIKLERNY